MNNEGGWSIFVTFLSEEKNDWICQFFHSFTQAVRDTYCTGFGRTRIINHQPLLFMKFKQSKVLSRQIVCRKTSPVCGLWQNMVWKWFLTFKKGSFSHQINYQAVIKRKWEASSFLMQKSWIILQGQHAIDDHSPVCWISVDNVKLR